MLPCAQRAAEIGTFFKGRFLEEVFKVRACIYIYIYIYIYVYMDMCDIWGQIGLYRGTYIYIYRDIEGVG